MMNANVAALFVIILAFKLFIWVVIPWWESKQPIIIPIIRKTFPKLIAEELIAVQPMSAPSGMAFQLRYEEDPERMRRKKLWWIVKAKFRYFLHVIKFYSLLKYLEQSEYRLQSRELTRAEAEKLMQEWHDKIHCN